MTMNDYERIWLHMNEYECFSSNHLFKQRFPSSMLLHISSLVPDGEDEELAPEVRPLRSKFIL